MFKYFIDIARALNPNIADTPDQLFAWRQTVAFVLVVVTGISIFHTSRANGWLDWAGLPGYVTMAQLQQLEQLARETREDQLVEQIIDLTRRYCVSFDAGDTSGMAFAFQQLQVARAKYYRLTRREYPQLMCSMSAQPSHPQ